MSEYGSLEYLKEQLEKRKCELKLLSIGASYTPPDEFVENISMITEIINTANNLVKYQEREIKEYEEKHEQK